MKRKTPRVVNVVELENAPFKCAKDADMWARSHGVVSLMSNVDGAGKGEVAISVHSLNKMLSGSALENSLPPALHFAALMRLRDIIRESFVGEVHPDYIKVDGKRSPDNGINPLVAIWVLYGGESFADFPCRVKTTLKRFLDNNFPSKVYSYEISNIEILRGTAAPVARPSNKISYVTFDLSTEICPWGQTPWKPKSSWKIQWGQTPWKPRMSPLTCQQKSVHGVRPHGNQTPWKPMETSMETSSREICGIVTSRQRLGRRH